MLGARSALLLVLTGTFCYGLRSNHGKESQCDICRPLVRDNLEWLEQCSVLELEELSVDLIRRQVRAAQLEPGPAALLRRMIKLQIAAMLPKASEMESNSPRCLREEEDLITKAQRNSTLLAEYLHSAIPEKLEVVQLVRDKEDHTERIQVSSFFTSHYSPWINVRLQALIAIFGKEFWREKTVLEVGCGKADIGRVLYELGARVTASDARPAYVDWIAKNRPELDTKVLDLDDDWAIQAFSQDFDVIVHFGVLYHLRDIEQALQQAAKRTKQVLILETECADSLDPLFKNCTFEQGSDQAYNYEGCRPSAAFVERVLDPFFEVHQVPGSLLRGSWHVYNWEITNTGKRKVGHRRMWVAIRNPTLHGGIITRLHDPSLRYQAPQSSFVMRHSLRHLRSIGQSSRGPSTPFLHGVGFQMGDHMDWHVVLARLRPFPNVHSKRNRGELLSFMSTEAVAVYAGDELIQVVRCDGCVGFLIPFDLRKFGCDPPERNITTVLFSLEDQDDDFVPRIMNVRLSTNECSRLETRTHPRFHSLPLQSRVPEPELDQLVFFNSAQLNSMMAPLRDRAINTIPWAVAEVLHATAPAHPDAAVDPLSNLSSQQVQSLTMSHPAASAADTGTVSSIPDAAHTSDSLASPQSSDPLTSPQSQSNFSIEQLQSLHKLDIQSFNPDQKWFGAPFFYGVGFPMGDILDWHVVLAQMHPKRPGELVALLGTEVVAVYIDDVLLQVVRCDGCFGFLIPVDLRRLPCHPPFRNMTTVLLDDGDLSSSIVAESRVSALECSPPDRPRPPEFHEQPLEVLQRPDDQPVVFSNSDELAHEMVRLRAHAISAGTLAQIVYTAPSGAEFQAPPTPPVQANPAPPCHITMDYPSAGQTLMQTWVTTSLRVSLFDPTISGYMLRAQIGHTVLGTRNFSTPIVNNVVRFIAPLHFLDYTPDLVKAEILANGVDVVCSAEASVQLTEHLPVHVTTVRALGVQLDVAAHSEESVTLLAHEVGEADVYSLRNLRLSPTDVALDFGANIGLVSMLLAKLYPATRIVAFEPVPLSRALLRRNLERNNITNVETPDVTVTHDSRLLRFLVNPWDLGRTQSIPAELEERANNLLPYMTKFGFRQYVLTETVETKPLTRILADLEIPPERVRFVKLDCEGCEYEMVDDLTRVMEGPMSRAIVRGELHPGPDVTQGGVHCRAEALLTRRWNWGLDGNETELGKWWQPPLCVLE